VAAVEEVATAGVGSGLAGAEVVSTAAGVLVVAMAATVVDAATGAEVTGEGCTGAEFCDPLAAPGGRTVTPGWMVLVPAR
jgi:hypothetical protein